MCIYQVIRGTSEGEKEVGIPPRRRMIGSSPDLEAPKNEAEMEPSQPRIVRGTSRRRIYSPKKTPPMKQTSEVDESEAGLAGYDW
ncbi:unnamed protein product [Linum trigynum]|uniref:Uncharacterized protein n=1 Tax=Linum trigynum TaxID=586398 RepID=A0AAV2CU09_9ROSI